jgi:hypothetical protein
VNGKTVLCDVEANGGNLTSGGWLLCWTTNGPSMAHHMPLAGAVHHITVIPKGAYIRQIAATY